jgi:hypothetical protein
MADPELRTSRDLLSPLIPIFEKVLGASERFKDALSILHADACAERLENLTGSLSLSSDGQHDQFRLLAICLNEARILQSQFLGAAFDILANASRDREPILLHHMKHQSG